jgi:hypothetical protein
MLFLETSQQNTSFAKDLGAAKRGQNQARIIIRLLYPHILFRKSVIQPSRIVAVECWHPLGYKQVESHQLHSTDVCIYQQDDS